MMKLNELLDYIQIQNWQSNLPLQTPLVGITIDSRVVKPGDIFVALPSVWPGRVGGEVHIASALKAGASVIITSDKAPDILPNQIAWIQVQNPHQVLSACAKAFYPKQPKHVVAVTGTNGKSSTIDFTFQYWGAAGFSCGKMGTIAVEDNQQNEYPGFKGLTTPDAILLHQNLHLMASNGIEYAAMEASSHALQQYRMDRVDVEVAAFTNLTHEHLDYHKDADDYFKAKARLFSALLLTSGTGILNRDDPMFLPLFEILQQRGVRVITYGRQQADFSYQINVAHEYGQDVRLSIFGKTYETVFPLIGDFQVANAVCAMANAILTGVESDQALTQFSKMQAVLGRLQCVGSSVYVDYAHTPDALATALKALRPHTTGRLLVVFGCGGNRDPTKRPLMGKVASELADVVYITDDNPRHEDPREIRQAILSSCPKGLDFASRTKAIYAAINDMQQGDVVLIAGKGHETGQIFRDNVQPFCDVQVATQILNS